MTRLKIAYVPLTDAAPLIVARENGHFERVGLTVELVQEQSWASVRDRLQTGRVDAAQMLASMPLALAAGASYARVDLAVGMVLSLNGNGVTVSSELYGDMERTGLLHDSGVAGPGLALKAVVDRRRALRKPPLCFASVFPTSTHYYLLRYWMASAGIDTDSDIRFVVIPPPRMVDALQSGLVDGCCVGEPWNHLAVSEFAGHIALTGYDIWHNAPEKVLAVRSAWLDEREEDYLRMTEALLAAGAWCDEPANRGAVAAMLASPHYLNVPQAVIAHSLAGQVCDVAQRVVRSVPDFHVFHRYCANLPWPSQAEWLLKQMLRWGQLAETTDLGAIAATVFRQDIFRRTAARAGYECPAPSVFPDAVASVAPGLELGARGFIDSSRP